MIYKSIPYLADYKTTVSNSGSRIKQSYTSRIDKHGVLYLEKSGMVDIYNDIQTDKDYCDINLIVARFTLGDATALDRVKGAYGDFTQMPKTLAEAYDMILRAEQSFESLPVDVKEKFNNSPSEFLAAVGSKKFEEAFSAYLSPTSPSGNEVKQSAPANEKGDVNE